MRRPAVLLLGPSRDAISGVTTHVNSLLDSRLAGEFALAHFQVGSEGRSEGAVGRMLRFVISPFTLAFAVLRRGAAVVHLNTSLNAKAWARPRLPAGGEGVRRARRAAGRRRRARSLRLPAARRAALARRGGGALEARAGILAAPRARAECRGAAQRRRLHAVPALQAQRAGRGRAAAPRLYRAP